jgi:hypothetical protein
MERLMEIRITFDGGDYHGQSALTDGLDEIKVFFLPLDRRVLAYRRYNETGYIFSQDVSERMTEGYDKALAYFSKEPLSSIRFEDEAGPIEPTNTSEPAIEFKPPAEGEFLPPTDDFLPPISFSDTPIDDQDGGTE